MAAKNLLERAKECRADACIPASAGIRERVQGGEHHARELSLLATADICERDAARINSEIARIDRALMALTEEQRQIITKLYIEGLDGRLVSDQCHVSQRAMYYKADEALKCIALILWGGVEP